MERVNDFHAAVQTTVSSNRRRVQEALKREALLQFTEIDYFIMFREKSTAGEMISLWWSGPSRIIRALDEHLYSFEEVCNGPGDEEHASCL